MGDSSGIEQSKTPWSTASLTQKEVKAWLKGNELHRKYKYGVCAQEILAGAERPFRYAATLLVLSVLLLLLGQQIQALLNYLDQQTYAASFDGNWASWLPSEQLSYFTALWGIQTTIAALVYPFVISFVTLLLQRRPASKVTLQIYLIDSGAISAGLSSLFLVLSMAFQYALLAHFSLGYAVTWVCIDTVWFSYNAWLTIWFLFRTVEFLRRDFQFAVIQRYAVCVALPRHFSRLLGFQFFATAQQRGWIRMPEYLDEKSKGKPQLLLMSYGLNMGRTALERSLMAPSRLTNVRFVPLKAAVYLWNWSAKRFAKKNNKDSSENPKSPLLILPLTPGDIYEDKVVLAQIENGPNLSPIQRFLLKRSFVFRSVKSERRFINPNEIMAELESDARMSAESADIAGFESAYEDLLSMHESLLRASRFGEENLARIPELHSFAEKRLHSNWIDSYRSLFDAAVGLLPKETRPFDRLCRIARHINTGPYFEQLPVEIREEVVFIYSRFKYVLSNWWSLRVEEQGAVQHDANFQAILKPPLYGAYEDALENFVSGWETARDSIVDLPDREDEFSWDEVNDLVRLSTAHINQTGLMLIRSVVNGDRASAEWMADVITKWWGSHSFYERVPFQVYHSAGFISVETISKPWDAVFAALDIEEVPGNLNAFQRWILLIAVKNYLLDILILVIESLVGLAIQVGDNLDKDQSLALYIASGLLSNKQWKHGGNHDNLISELSPAGYLNIKARQFSSDENFRRGYTGRLDSFVESVNDLGRPRMISGRIYGFSGFDDVASLQDAQLAIFITLSKNPWRISEGLKGQLAKWAASQFQRTGTLRDGIKSAIKRLTSTDGKLSTIAVEALMASTYKSHTVAEGIERTLDGLKAVEEEIAALQAAAISAAEISPQRLNEIEVAASKEGFSKDSGEFPIQIFGTVECDSSSRIPFTLTILKQRRGEFTAVEMQQRAANELEWYTKTIATHVGAKVLSEVLSRCTTKNVVAPDPTSYWSVLQEESARLRKRGLTPLLILDNATRPEWIWSWEYAHNEDEYKRPDGLVVTHHNRGDGYLYDLNDIQVFIGHISEGRSLLLARETFHRVSFTEYRDDVFVQATIVGSAESNLLVDLKLTYQHSVEVEFPEVVSIQYRVGLSN